MIRKVKITIRISHKLKHQKNRNLSSVHSKDIDKYLISRYIVLNTLIRSGNPNIIFRDKDNVYYFHDLYILYLRASIIASYRKSEDPIHEGNINESNLKYTLDFMKNIYSNVKPQKNKIVYKAAFMLFNIISKHPFVDGNKRTAIVACNTFLELNQYTLGKLPYREASKFILAVAENKKTERDCRDFVRYNLHAISLTEGTKKILKNKAMSIK